MALDEGTNWAKVLGLVLGTAFVVWFLYEGFQLIGRFMEKY